VANQETAINVIDELGKVIQHTLSSYCDHLAASRYGDAQAHLNLVQELTSQMHSIEDHPLIVGFTPTYGRTDTNG